MTLSSSLNASVTGLAANASRLATISDNIANSATYGYKRADTEFHSMVINSTGAYAAGGVRSTATRIIDQAGSLVSTSNSTDISVRGRGLLPMTNETQVAVGNGEVPLLLSTTGSFRTDADGYLTTPTGLVLMGWPANVDGSVDPFPRDSTKDLEPVRVNLNQFTSAPTTAISLVVNLPATSATAGAPGDAESLSIDYFDNLGNSPSLLSTFTPTGAANTWTMTLTDSSSGGAVVGEYTIEFDDSRTGGGTLKDVTTLSGGAYDPSTGEIDITVAGGGITVSIGTYGSAAGITQLSDTFAPVAISKDGNAVGTLTAIEIDQNGRLSATFDTGTNRVLYQVPLVDVPNMNGLETLDEQTYSISTASGSFFLWDAGDGPTGDIVGYSREESTTEIAGELTELIQTQRAYSSIAKVFQTVDEMLQETTNIKR